DPRRPTRLARPRDSRRSDDHVRIHSLGQAGHRRRPRRNHHLVECLPHGIIEADVGHGQRRNDPQMVRQTPPSLPHTGQCHHLHRLPLRSRTVPRREGAELDLGRWSPAIVIAYFLVSVGFLVLRRREPEMERPLRVGGSGRGGLVISATSSVLTLILFILYLPITPFSAELDWRSWVMCCAWLLVCIFFVFRLPT